MIKNKNILYTCTFSLILTLSACTTALYGGGFELIPDTRNVYSLKVYIGGFSGGATADKRVAEEIEQYMQKHDYTSYKIISRRHNLIPSYFEYHVRFRGQQVESSGNPEDVLQ